MARDLNDNMFQNIGVGVASLTFGVALSIFIYSVVSDRVVGISSWLLFLASFLLMLRFWWRYVDLFVRSLPSQTFWQFFFDFAISFFGISAVLFVAKLQLWTVLVGAGMISSIVRCGLSWKSAEGDVLLKLKRTFFGAVGMLVLMMAAYFAAFLTVPPIVLAVTIFVLIVLFVSYAARKP